MRGLLILAYLTLTALTCVSAMVKSSLSVGAAALAGSLLCFFAVATFCASFLAKREHQYKATDLLGIGAIATVLTVTGFALMIWSGFWISLYGVVIEGPYWVLIGILAAIVTAKKSFALWCAPCPHEGSDMRDKLGGRTADVAPSSGLCFLRLTRVSLKIAPGRRWLERSK